MKKSKFVSLSQLASKATGGAYGTQAPPSLPPSSSSSSSSANHYPTSAASPFPTTGATTPGPYAMPPTPVRDREGGSSHHQQQPKRATWADRVREKLPPLGENEYEVLWERGVLGVIFLESEKDGIPYVSKATESCISPMVAPGDILKFVNVVRSKDHSFSDFFKILATMKKPVLLRFERPSSNSITSTATTATSSSSNPRSTSPGTANSSITNDPLDQRSVSATDMNNGGGRANNLMKDAAKAIVSKVSRSNSLPQSENKQKPVTRGAFWRGSSARDPQPSAMVNSPVGKGAKYNDDVDDEDSDTSDSPRGDDDDLQDDHDYQMIEVYWETGSLGLFFGEERGSGHPVVTRSTPGVNPSVHRKVQVNDVLLMANGIRSADYTFEAFFARLQQMSKPVKLVFRRKETPVDVGALRGRKPSVAADSMLEPPAPPPAPPLPPSQPVQTTITNASRPSRLPPPISRNDLEVEKTERRPSGASATQVQPSPKTNGYPRHESSPSSKPRSTSVEDRIVEEERIPSSGALHELRGKSPSRPDIVYLGSPKRRNRPPPPAPPGHPVVDHMPSPRESVPMALNRLPSPQRPHMHVPSPTGQFDPPRMARTPTRLQSPIYVLGDDFDNSPVHHPDDVVHDVNEDDTEGTVDTPEAQRLSAGGRLSEEIPVGVPVETAEIEEGEAHLAEAAEAAEVAEEVFTVALDEAVTQARAKPVQEPLTPAEPEEQVEFGVPVGEVEAPDSDLNAESEPESDDDLVDSPKTDAESEDSEPPDVLEQEDPDISIEREGNEDTKSRESLSSPAKPNNKAALNASLAKYKKRAKNSRPLVKLPALMEDVSQTVPLVAPNAVNTNVQVRGRSKPKPSLLDTPDNATYLVKWKEGRSVGLQLREVRLAKGTFPLVVDVCKEPCCESLKHVCIGDVIVEINSRNCSTMGVKKTVTFLKTSSKTMLLKFRRGPAFVNERVSASL